METKGDTPHTSLTLGTGPWQTSKRGRIQDQSVSKPKSKQMLLLLQQHALSMLQLMQEMYDSRQLCDVVLAVEGKLIPAHRLVLSACSPYFHAMFTSELRESKEDTVALRDVNSDAVEAIVNFAYNTEIDINEDNVQALLSAASLFQMETVRNLCSDFLKTQFHPTNCLGIKNFAEVHSCFDLEEAAMAYILQNFTKIVAHDEFLQLDVKDLVSIINKDDLNITKEEEVYYSTLHWLRYDLKNRWKFISDVFEHVRLPLLSRQFLNEHVMAEKTLKVDHGFKKFVDEATRYHSTKFSLGPHRVESTRTVPRHSCDPAQFIYVIGGEVTATGVAPAGSNILSSAERYHPATDKWSPLPPMHQSRHRIGVASMEGSIYAVGGAASSPLRDVECYDPQTDSWRKVAKMNVARSSVAVATMGGQLYACGGYDGKRSVGSVEQYDPDLNKWRLIKEMRICRSMAAAVSHAGLLYVVGGYNGRSDINTMERYDPVLKEWKILAPMEIKRSMMAAVCLNEKIYVMGGSKDGRDENIVEVYHPAQEKWTVVKGLIQLRSGVGAAVVHNRLYAVGGHNRQENLHSVEQYDEEKDEWKIVTDMEVARRRFGCCS